MTDPGPVRAIPTGPPGPREDRGPLRRLLPPLLTIGAIGAAFTYVGLVDPNESGHYPVCPLYALTGLYCPGCGGLRSAHAVAHGDLAAAFGANAAAVVGYALFAVGWLVWVARARKGLPAPIPRAPAVWWTVGVVLVLFTVVRNLPFGGGLAP